MEHKRDVVRAFLDEEFLGTKESNFSLPTSGSRFVIHKSYDDPTVTKIRESPLSPSFMCISLIEYVYVCRYKDIQTHL